jgi:hypothetical protein
MNGALSAFHRVRGRDTFHNSYKEYAEVRNGIDFYHFDKKASGESPNFLQRNRMKPFKIVLRNAVYRLFLFALIYAPFAYGCTRPDAIVGLERIVGIAFCGWLLLLLVERRLPRISRLAWIPIGVFGFEIVVGWWMAENASSIYDFDYNAFVPGTPFAESLPGSVAGNASIEAMWPLTALFAAYCIASEMANDGFWRRSLFRTMALTGIALALFGIVLKLGGTPAMSVFWEPEKISGTNFALYRYHGNAGSFLNLVWPLVLAFGWSVWEQFNSRQITSHLAAVGWGLGLAICWAGVLMNASKFALMIFLFLLPIFVILRARSLLNRTIGPVTWRKGILLALIPIAGLVLWLFASASSFGTSSGKIYRLAHGINAKGTVDDRLLAIDAESTMLHDAGWHGFGPGTFRVEFPYYTGFLGDHIQGYWFYAHEDYLQTWIEWGWQGCVMWGIVVLGGLARAWWLFKDRTNFLTSEDRILWLGGCLSLTGLLLHALVDFPLQVLSLDLYALTLVGVFWSRPKAALVTVLPDPGVPRRRAVRTRSTPSDAHSEAELSPDGF